MTTARAASLEGAVAAAPAGLDAVLAADAHLTYAELLARADLLADRLRDLGAGEGSLVGVCLPRSAALVVAWLGVLRAGAAYVALDPSQPGDRLRTLVADAGVALVVVGPGGPFGDPDDLGVVRVAELGTVVEPGLAYVVYTSGSTGTPKGVMVESAGVLNLAAWHGRAFDVTTGTRVSQLAGVGFDAAGWEVWGTLAHGGTLVVPPESLKTDPAALRDWLVAERIEVAFLPTALAETVVALAWPADAALRVVLTGGDQLHAAPPTGLPFALVNNYGLSEASVVTTSGTVVPGAAGLPSIGAPIEGVSVRILGPDLVDAVEGELVVGGVSVARGYLGAPELTAQRFVELDGERWYRTGDRARWEGGGAIAYAGRLDDQVQVRGFRVEPAEVEATIRSHAGVEAAVVRTDGGRLVAWVQGDVDDDALRAHLAGSLPSAMVPSAFVPVAHLPITPNGKVDIAALPRPAVVAPAAPGVPDDDGDDLTRAVAEVIAEVLGVPAVRADESFLLLGGHSLLGAQLVIRLGDAYGVELGLRDVFDEPTAAGIASRIRGLLIDQIVAGQPG